MVLHNSKWDRKATRSYYKKHGMAPPPRKPRQPGPQDSGGEPTNNDSDGGSSGENDYEDDVPETEINNPDNISSLVPDLPDGAAKKSKWDQPRRKVLTSNSWRYGDESGGVEGAEDDERMMDEAQLEQLGFERAQRQIEQEELALARSVKFDPREIDLNKPFQPIGSGGGKKNHKNSRYGDTKDDVYMGDQDADLSEFLVADKNEDFGATEEATQATVKPKKGNIQKLEDKDEFYKLQREIEKSKAAKEIARKFGSSSKKSSYVGNSSSSSGKKSTKVSEEQNIDDFLNSIDGLSISGKGDASSGTTAVDVDELDELLATALSGNLTSTSFSGVSSYNYTQNSPAEDEKISLFAGSQVQKKPTQKAVQYNEAWLDNLLS